MSSDKYRVINKKTLDGFFNRLSKEYKKVAGRNMSAEIIVVGGAAVIEMYGFRENTSDIDAIIDAASSMKEAINRVSDDLRLPHDWINTDFMKTSSFSHKLRQYSKYYKTFNQALTVRVVSGEYLIAMKLASGRDYHKTP